MVVVQAAAAAGAARAPLDPATAGCAARAILEASPHFNKATRELSLDVSEETLDELRYVIREAGAEGAAASGWLVDEEWLPELQRRVTSVLTSLKGGRAADGKVQGANCRLRCGELLANAFNDRLKIIRVAAEAPGLGARVLVKNNFPAVVNPILAEMMGWQEDARVRASKLLRANLVFLEAVSYTHLTLPTILLV